MFHFVIITRLVETCGHCFGKSVAAQAYYNAMRSLSVLADYLEENRQVSRLLP